MMGSEIPFTPPEATGIPKSSDDDVRTPKSNHAECRPWSQRAGLASQAAFHDPSSKLAPFANLPRPKVKQKRISEPRVGRSIKILDVVYSVTLFFSCSWFSDESLKIGSHTEKNKNKKIVEHLEGKFIKIHERKNLV